MARDYYELLGVSPSASPEEIKRAYRRLARELHPDASGGNPESEARFKEVAVAYEVLSDPERRRRYDMFGPEGVGAGAGAAGDPFGFGGGGISDLFNAFFGGGGFAGDRRAGGPTRGPDLEVVLELDFADAVFGTQQPVSVRTAVPCDTCEGSGAAPGTSARRCDECGGQGQVRRVRQSILGQMVTASPCPRCSGMGEVIDSPCADCGGEGRKLEEKSYRVDIPAGVDTGSTLRLSGRGAAGPRGGGHGDLYVHVEVRAHPRFKRQAYDLVDEQRVSMAQAALGAHIKYETLDGSEDLVIPPGTQSGRVFRLRGRGVPHVEGRGRGDLLVQILVDVPTNLSREEDELLRQFAAARGEEVAPPDNSFFGRIRSAFR
jgi:molecular chaperone DnaJ